MEKSAAGMLNHPLEIVYIKTMEFPIIQAVRRSIRTIFSQMDCPSKACPLIL